MNEKKLYLIDGHALVYRAYFAFAKNPLINSKGQPTGAVYGFANYLIKLIESHPCSHMAVVLDSSKPTFRHEMYSQYKANREEMPSDLRAQMPLITELIEALNIPMVKQDGLEADDLIAYLTYKGINEDYNVFLVTRDKDLMQLVGPKVKMLAPDGTGTLLEMGVNEVKEKMGVAPEQIVDYLALIGDASDNIPGVPGVGPKTAVKILETCGSVQKILDDPSILGNVKLIQKIEANRELLCISKMLATLKTDIDIALSIDDLICKPIDKVKSVALFRELEFSSLVRHPLFGGSERFAPAVKICETLKQASELIEKISVDSAVSIVPVTTGTLSRAAKLTGLAVAVSSTDAFYFPVDNTSISNISSQELLSVFKNLIESSGIKKVGHNLKFDYQVFKNYGLCMQGLSFDTMIAAYLLDSGKREYDLEILFPEFLNTEITSINTLIPSANKSGLTINDLPIEKVASWAAERVCAPLALLEKLQPLLIEKKCDTLFNTVEMPLVAVLGDLEWHGIRVDTELLKTLSVTYGAQLQSLSDEIYALAGESLNLNSPKQIGEVLFDKLLIPAAKKTKSGGHSTSFEVLEKLAPDYPIVQKILDYRELQKLLSTYIDSLPAQILVNSGRIHSSFNQTIAATGRLSSTNPNLQNIPIRSELGKKIREAFIAADGYVLISADYSQIELRILAHLSRDPLLIQAFTDDQDIHTQTASAIYKIFPELVTSEMRRVAKTINFGLMYGMGPINLSRQLGISFGEAKLFIETYFQQFPTIKQYMESTIVSARQLGFSETLLGRRRYLPEINASNKNIREAAERTAINTPVQGTAADIIKIAMINIHRELSGFCGDAKMLLQVHDELVFEVPEKDAEAMKQWIIEKMSSAYALNVPLKVEAGFAVNWGMAH